MFLIKKTKSFEKSFKKVKNSGAKRVIFKDLGFVIDLLASGKSLPSIYKDHKLSGELNNCRECHIKGDLLLIYQIHDDILVFVLVDIGSHSYLFG